MFLENSKNSTQWTTYTEETALETNENKTQATSLISAAEWQRTSNTFKGMSPIDYLFEKFKNLYMNKWTSQFTSPKELNSWKEAWAEELSEQGISFTEVKNGLDYCKKRHQDWPPTFPQFLEACRPSIDYEESYNEALVQMAKRETGEDVWSHPAIFWAYRSLGSDIKGSTYALIKKRWEVALKAAIEGVENGKIEPVVPKKEMPAGYLPRPKREHGNYSKVALEEIAKQKIILETEPAWKKALREKGKDTSSPRAGLRPMSDFVQNLTKSKEEVA